MKTSVELTRDSILSKVRQEDIFERYLGIRPEFDTQFTNPLREDESPGCRFYVKSGRIRFIDFSRGWNWDCFDVVMFAHPGYSYHQALVKIAVDFGINMNYVLERTDRIVPNPVVRRGSFFKGGRRITFMKKKFTDRELTFWRRYGIDRETLELYRVSSVRSAWIQYPDGTKKVAHSQKYPEMCFCYDLGWGNRKLYFPERRRGRFLQNTSKVVEGYLQLPEGGEFVVITKSYKDVMSMRGFDLWAIAPSSETILLPEKFMSRIISSFDRVFTLFDNDLPGKRATIKYRNIYGTTPLLFPSDMEKDFSDNYFSQGLQFMVDLVLSVKEKYL